MRSRDKIFIQIYSECIFFFRTTVPRHPCLSLVFLSLVKSKTTKQIPVAAGKNINESMHSNHIVGMQMCHSSLESQLKFLSQGKLLIFPATNINYYLELMQTMVILFIVVFKVR